MTQTLIIAHRGASFDAPENTLPAFERAIAERADGIEFDVRLACDGVPICIHDVTLRRTGLSNGHVSRLSAAELTTVDAGTWFNRTFPKRARAEFASARIPTLADALRCCRQAGREFQVFIEMKPHKDEAARLAQTVAQVIRAEGEGVRVVVASFKLDAIRAVKVCDASIPTAGLFEPTMTNPRPAIAESIARATDAGASALMLHRSLVNRRTAERAQAAGLPVTVWTVDDKGWMRRALDYGLHALITNRPAQMLAWRDDAQTHVP